MVTIKTPLLKENIIKLKAGQTVKLTGVIYTARDAAHKRLIETYKQGKELPICIKNNILYYVGPSPAKPGQIIGSAGPTTSYRMDDYTPTLLELGLSGMIGKGDRKSTVVQSMIANKAVYFAAVGGAAALISSRIKKSEVIAYEDLGSEAIRKLYVEDFPLIVVIDCYGKNLYEIEKLKYKKNKLVDYE